MPPFPAATLPAAAFSFAILTFESLRPSVLLPAVLADDPLNCAAMGVVVVLVLDMGLVGLRVSGEVGVAGVGEVEEEE